VGWDSRYRRVYLAGGGEMSHTPGPWRVEAEGLIYAGDVLIGQAVALYKDEPGYREANAHLIAAAPKMLGALKEAQAQLYKLGVRMGHVESVIDEATGGAL
jgi:hypothetical protein